MNLKSVVAALATTALLASSVTSCTYDDTEIWKELDSIKQEVTDLRTQVENELGALTDLVNGIVITEVSQKSDGSTEVTLSNGMKLTIYPKGADTPANVVTVTEIDGVLYWALIDGLGTAHPIQVGGKNVPVGAVAPQTRESDGAIEVSFDGGTTWITTGYSESAADALFVDIDVVYSDWQEDEDGNPIALYCLITLNDGSTIKVGMQNGRLILPYDSLFAAYGCTVPFTVDAEDAADFMTQIPSGWGCDVEHDTKRGTMTMVFTAPTLDEILAGAAEAEGIAKLMVVFNNGSSAIARIKLSTNAAEVYFTEEGFHIHAGYGLNYMLYGIVDAEKYEETYFPNLKTWCESIMDNTAVDGGNAQKYVRQLSFMETVDAYVTYADARSAKMTAGTEYTFWYVSPRTDADGDLYILEDEIMTVNFTHTVSTFTVANAGFTDVNIKLTATGSKGYMLGYSFAEDFDAEALAAYYTENPDYLTFTNDAATYEGSFLTLFDPATKYLLPDTEYVAWYITDRDTNVILEDNVRHWSFKTAAFAEGGDVEVSTSNSVIGYTDITTTLSTTAGHIAMYYMFVPSYETTAYPDDAARVAALLRDGTRVISTEAVEAAYTKAKAGEEFTLFAMAVGADGKYGKFYSEVFKTKKFEYNTLKVELEVKEYTSSRTAVAVTCEGAAKYVYVCVPTNSRDWSDFGGTAKKAGEYIIAHPEDSRICDTSKEEYAMEEGMIVISGLTIDLEYALVVMAVDAEGMYSQPKATYIIPISDLGTVVKKTDANWAEGKPTLTMGETSDVEFFNIQWFILPQEGYVAYSIALHPDNFVNEELGTNINTVEKLISYMISMCDTGKNDEGRMCVYEEDGIYTREWKTMEDINGDGRFDHDEWVTKTQDYTEGVYNKCFYGTKGVTLIFTTWVGEDGNFHEPFVYDPTTEKELTDWTLEEAING